MTVTAQSLIVVDTRGRLVEFRRVPPQRDANAGESAAPDWNAMFRAAGLEPGRVYLGAARLDAEGL